MRRTSLLIFLAIFAVAANGQNAPKASDRATQAKVATEAKRQQREDAKAAPALSKQRALLKPIMDARMKKDYKREVVLIDKTGKAHPELSASLAYERFAAMAEYDEAGAQKYAGRLAGTTFKNDPMQVNSLVRSMVEDGSPMKHPNATLAVKMAHQAYKVSKEDPMIGETLALAYYRAKDRAMALKTQKRVLAKAAANKQFDPAMLVVMKSRLKMYQTAPAKTK